MQVLILICLLAFDAPNPATVFVSLRPKVGFHGQVYVLLEYFKYGKPVFCAARSPDAPLRSLGGLVLVPWCGYVKDQAGDGECMPPSGTHVLRIMYPCILITV